MQVTASAITSKQTMKISFDKSSMSPIKSNNVNFLGDEWYLRMDNDGVSFQINTFFLGCSRRSIFFLKEFVCLSLNRAYGPSSSASDIIYEIRFMGSADQSLTVKHCLEKYQDIEEAQALKDMPGFDLLNKDIKEEVEKQLLR
uniref:MATH domain-containing protein n=1 Tax=Ditylenchus dipsaci TaxID=166011 RepID=A0A915CUL2_9BILA